MDESQHDKSATHKAAGSTRRGAKRIARSEDMNIGRRIAFCVAIIAGGAVAYLGGQIVGTITAQALLAPFGNLTEMQQQLISYAIVQAVIVAVLVGLVRLLAGGNMRARLGLGAIRNWSYFLLLPLIYLASLMVSGVVSILFSQLVPSFDVDQSQNLGLPPVIGSSDLVLIGVLLVIAVPLAEEFVFRGYLFGMLRKYSSFVVSAVIVSILFGVAHGQWNVGLITFVLSLALCFIREKTGSIWTGVGLHALQNFVAFLLLYVYEVI